MTKKEALKKLEERKDELQKLPKYTHDGDNSKFDEWKMMTATTIRIIFKEHPNELHQFNSIKFQELKMLASRLDFQGHMDLHNEGRMKANTQLKYLIKYVKDFHEDEDSQEGSTLEAKTNSLDKSKVFIVHGHDSEIVKEVQLFLEKIGLKGIVLREQASQGKSIMEKLEEHTDVGFAIVLYTPCDLGKAKKDKELKERARQNVVFEHGFLVGKLGRKNVAIIKDGEIETPGDISGTVYLSASNDWGFGIIKELKAAEYKVNANDLF